MKRNRRFVQFAMPISVLFALIGLITGDRAFATSQEEREKNIKGFIAFDFPNAPQPKIEVHLDRKLISLVAKSATQMPEIAELLAMLDGVYVHSYDGEAANFDEMRRYYENKLTQGPWERIVRVKEEDETVQVHARLDQEEVRGLFVIVAGQTETHIVNIVGRIQPERLGELLANLGGLGLELPQLKLFGTSQIEVGQEKSGDQNQPQPLAENRTEKSILNSHAGSPNISFASTHFVDREGRPINEVRIQGNQKVSTVEIRRALEMGPDNIDNAIKLMKSTLPFKKVDWRIHEEKERRIATITVVEKGLVDTKLNMRGAFNRVDGLRLGPTVEWLRRPDIGTPPRGKLFGDLTYGFSNKIWNYTLGAQTGGGVLHRMNLTFTAQIHRLTVVRDKDVLPSDGEQFFMAFLYGGDFRDYYLRDGSEVSLRWQTETAPHSLTLTMLDEEHQSLEKSTDWSLVRRDAIKDENPQITPGHLRTAALRYDFDTRSRREGVPDGWYHTFDAEHSSAGVGSDFDRLNPADFDFTRFQVHLRRYLRIHGNSLNARLKFGISTGALPIQRQFFLGGPGTLGGYGLYEFAGAQMALLNLEYRPHLLGTSFTLFFVDIGNVWERFAAFDANDLKVDMGVGLIVGDEEAGFRLSLAQALELGRRPQFNVRWSRMF